MKRYFIEHAEIIHKILIVWHTHMCIFILVSFSVTSWNNRTQDIVCMSILTVMLLMWMKRTEDIFIEIKKKVKKNMYTFFYAYVLNQHCWLARNISTQSIVYGPSAILFIDLFFFWNGCYHQYKTKWNEMKYKTYLFEMKITSFKLSNAQEPVLPRVAHT